MQISHVLSLKVGDIAILLNNPLFSFVCIGDKIGRVIKSNHPDFKIDDLVKISGKIIFNKNLNIEFYVKEYGALPIGCSFIYGQRFYEKLILNTKDKNKVRAYDVERDSIRHIFSTEEVYVLSEKQ